MINKISEAGFFRLCNGEALAGQKILRTFSHES